MRISELLRLVWLNITQNKFKTIMTSIGIIVGAATIVMVIAIGKGGQMDVADQFQNLNAGAIDITCEVDVQQGGGKMPGGGGMPGGGKMPGGGGTSGGGKMSGGSGTSGGGKMPGGGGMPEGGRMPGGGGIPEGGEMPGGGERPEGMEPPEGMERPDGMEMPFGDFGMELSTELEQVTLTEEDAEGLLGDMDSISDATISYTTRASAEGGDLEEATVYTVAGVQANYAALSNFTLSAGEFLTEEANTNKEKVCILGAETAEEIFGSAMEAYGSILYIDQRIYVVDGVLEKMGTVSSGISPDEAIFIPYETGIKYLVGENVNPTLTIIARDVEKVDQVIAEATELLAETYPNSEFTFSDAGSKMEAAEASNQILTMLLIAMASIVFIVGGIGIMNVLFVSVKERTNEIGILKAIGCGRGSIMVEFLLEASATSFIGGILGVLASLAITPIVRHLQVRVELSGAAFVVALVFAVVTGTLFGFYPAYKASKLVPVEALNAE